MADFQLSQREALGWAGDHEWNKGQSYVRDLSGLTAQPDGEKWLLQGHAQGQEKYTVRATLKGGGVVQAHCSCYVGAGGRCKHVAALLARAVKSPGDFTELSDLGRVLEGLDADELRGLVRSMLEREPELLRLVLTRPGAGGRKGAKSGDFSDLRQRIEDALSLVDYDPEQDWEGEGLDLSEFMPLIDELKEGLARAADLDVPAREELLACCLALLSGAQELQDDDYGVETDDLFIPARTGLLRLLHLPLDGNLRETALEALQDSIAELGWPRYEIDSENQFELYADLPADERRLILDFVRRLQQTVKESYVRQGLAELLFVLTAEENLGFEEEMELARATGDQADVVHVLFKHERVEEAIQALGTGGRALAPQQVQEYFAGRGLLPRLEEYAQKNLKVFGSRAWLYQRYRETGRNAQAHALAREAVLKGTGDHDFYTSAFLTRDPNWLKELKAVSPDWPADRAEYIKKVWKSLSLTAHLMRFLLEENLLDEAQKLAQQNDHVPPGLLNTLAQRLPAEQAKPLLLKAAVKYVAEGNRTNYALAAQVLSESIPVVGREEARAMARLLLQDNPRLRALPEELKKAGLA